jgi:hypothetical protein
MNNPMIFAHLREVYNDLDKILDAAEEGRVPLTIGDDGNPTDWENYTMSSNAQRDVYNIQRDIRRIIIQFEGGM